MDSLDQSFQPLSHHQSYSFVLFCSYSLHQCFGRPFCSFWQHSQTLMQWRAPLDCLKFVGVLFSVHFLPVIRGEDEPCAPLVWPVDWQTEETPVALSALTLHQITAQVSSFSTPFVCLFVDIYIFFSQLETKVIAFCFCRYCRDLLIKTVPVTQVDFTSVLPRFLSLYVMSFLSPCDLCSAAQVSWHWRVLAEQVRGEIFEFYCSFPTCIKTFSCVSFGPGLSLGRPVHHKRLVPPLRSRRERIWSVEEPLCLLRLHAGLANPPGGGRAVRDPQPAKHRDDGGRRREGEGKDDQADDQR